MRNLRLFILLSVMIISVAGCATKTTKPIGDDVVDITETVEPTREPVTETVEQKTDKEEHPTQSVSNSEAKEVEISKDSLKSDNQTDTPKEQKTEKPKEQNTEKAKEEKPKSPEAKKEEEKTSKKPEEKPSEPEKPKSVSYDPNQVRSLAISKCQAGGMITTEDNLAKNLAEGKITQEEYNEYYPLDGLEGSYYSVFVETDLNQASTTSGRKLGSVDSIAQYIADMLLLEQEPVFNITYAGITTKGGTDFYEFKCHR